VIVRKGEITESKRDYFDDETIACILDFMQFHAQPINAIKNNFGIKSCEFFYKNEMLSY
jgi:hypothetical protein